MEMKPEQKTEAIVSITAKMLAITSVIIVIAWLFVTLVFWGNEDIEKSYYMIYTGWSCWFAAFLCGIISLRATKNIKGSLWSQPLALAGCVLSIFFTLVVTYAMSEVLEGRKDDCIMNLNMLSASIKVYCGKHDGEFPDSSKWCDLLLSEPPNESDDKYGVLWKYFSEKSFRCRAVTEGRSGYAFNKNLAGKRISEVDPNTVVLFETTAGGWNQNGGPEIMCPDRHKCIFGENGSYVVFLGKDKPIIKYVPRSETNKLRWNP